MQVMRGDQYFALREAGASKDLARKAAEEAATYHLELLQKVRAPVNVMRLPAIPWWLLQVLFALVVAGHIALFGEMLRVLTR